MQGKRETQDEYVVINVLIPYVIIYMYELNILGTTEWRAVLTNWMVYVGRLTGIFPTLIFVLASRKVDTFHEINDVCHVSEQKVYCCVQCSVLTWFYNQIIRDKVVYRGLNPWALFIRGPLVSACFLHNNQVCLQGVNTLAGNQLA